MSGARWARGICGELADAVVRASDGKGGLDSVLAALLDVARSVPGGVPRRLAELLGSGDVSRMMTEAEQTRYATELLAAEMARKRGYVAKLRKGRFGGVSCARIERRH